MLKNIIPFKPNQKTTKKSESDPFSDVYLHANEIPVNYSDIAMQLGLSPYSSAPIDFSQKPDEDLDEAKKFALNPSNHVALQTKTPVIYSDIAMQLGLDPTSDSNVLDPIGNAKEPVDIAKKPVDIDIAKKPIAKKPIAIAKNFPNMDTDRAEAMIMQLLGGDENALSSIRTRDINRDSALRSAVATERNDAITREFNELEKNRQRAEEIEKDKLAREEKERKDEAEKKEKIMEAEKAYNDAKANLDSVETKYSNNTKEFKDARNNYNFALKKLKDLDPKKYESYSYLSDDYVPKDMPSDSIHQKLQDIISEIEDVKGIFAKKGGFTNDERDEVLSRLDTLSKEKNISEEDKKKIDETKNNLNNKISKETLEVWAKIKKQLQQKNRNILIEAIENAKNSKVSDANTKLLNDYGIKNTEQIENINTSSWKAIKELLEDNGTYNKDSLGVW